jgi:hypothetical protein
MQETTSAKSWVSPVATVAGHGEEFVDHQLGWA